jgi:hypothetical protein
MAGAQHARQYRRPSGLAGTARHVRITWRDAMGDPLQLEGPFTFGSGRFRGLGVMFSDVSDPMLYAEASSERTNVSR